MKIFDVYSAPRQIYKKMLFDIKNAKKHIYLETYIFGRDEIGRDFKRALARKAREGVKVYLLLDSWGSQVDKKYFSRLIKARGKVRFFREVRYVIRWFTKNHERNHRKLLLIDGNILYLGSMNITSDCLDWRELVIRFEGSLAEHFELAFKQNWRSFGKITKKRLNVKFHKGFEIIQDIPRGINSLENKYLHLIKKAKKNILIETPYFVPSHKILKSFSMAIKRGVKIKLLIPYKSDVQAMDIFRNRYLGRLYKTGVEIYYYMPRVLHSKLMIIDSNFFILGSSNLDYRSFLHQHEINLIGINKHIIRALKEFFNQGLADSAPFDYDQWRSRSSFEKIIEVTLSFVKEYL